MENSVRRSLLATLNVNRRVDLIWRSRIRLLLEKNKPSNTNPQIFVHLVPLSTENFLIDRRNQQIFESSRSMRLLFDRFPNYHRINFDGYQGYAISGQSKTNVVSYFQMFWDGSIELYDENYLKVQKVDDKEMRYFHLPHFESYLVKGIKTNLQFLKSIQVPLPMRIYLAIVGAKGYTAFASQNSWYYHCEDNFIDRDDLYFDPVTIDDWDVDLGRSLRPLFDQLWNAGNFPRSLSYTENGDWKPQLE